MSFDLNVTGRNIKFDPEAWESEIAKHLAGFAFVPSMDWEAHSGFLPVSWIDPGDPGNRVESGFEFSFEEEEVQTSVFKKIFSGSPGKKVDYLFSFSSSGEEFRAGWISAGALAKVLNASLSDPQNGECYEGSNAMAQALKAIQPSKPSGNNRYDTFDFQALSAFQKKNEKEVHKLAKEIFQAHKIVRKGTSRIWLDDQGWYTGIIEFLPSRHYWSMIVNVAVNFHWDKSDSMSFHFSLDRSAPKFENAEEYAANNRHLVQDTLQRMLGLRDRMSDLDSVKASIIESSSCFEPHKSFHLGIISGLSGDTARMHEYFNAVLATKEEEGVDWIRELKDDVRVALEHSTHPEMFREYILDRIPISRTLKKLPSMKIELPVRAR